MQDRVILHCDLNNFYASVEQVLNPDLIGKPIAVCGDPEKRHGIVLAKSTVAKQAGVQTAEPIWQAKRKCPDLIIVPPHYNEYVKYSKIVREIYVEFTAEVESFGLDECWLDVTGSQKLFGTPKEIAEKIREEVKRRTGGLTVSIGVSFTKVFAKLGSDLKKPDAVTVIDRNNYKKVAWSLDVGEMLYVGRSTRQKLKMLNINTIGDLANADTALIKRLFGKSGESMLQNARGIETDAVRCYTDRHIPESIGNGTTTPDDIASRMDASSVIYALSEMVAFRMRSHGAVGDVVTISVRDKELKHCSRQAKLHTPTNASDVIAKKALALLDEFYDFRHKLPIRTITVTMHGLSMGGDFIQVDFLDDSNDKNEKLDQAIDKLRSKFGYNIIKRALNIGTIYSCDRSDDEEDFIPFDKRMNAQEGDKIL